MRRWKKPPTDWNNCSIGTCEDGDDCDLGAETFRFKDPISLGDDWMHTSEFEKA